MTPLRILAVALALVLGCAHAPLEGERIAPGLHEFTLSQWIGLGRRDYVLYVPRGYDGAQALPLLVAVHGAFSTVELLRQRTGFDALADEKGFLVAYPRGMGLFDWLRHWNSGHCCGPARLTLLDDVGYLDQVIDDVSARARVDRSRVYMAGFSNGGMMTHRYAAERSERLAAAAVASGTIGGKPASGAPVWRVPSPRAPVPIVIIHGREDPVVQYDGGLDQRSPIGRTWLSVAESSGFWARANHCDGDAVRRRQGAIEVESWEDCADGARVRLYSIDGWGHIWPGPSAVKRTSIAPLAGFDAARTIWTFFEMHRRTAATVVAGRP